MNIWIKRSLSTAALTGGLLLAGAAAASADGSHHESESENSSSISSPIEIGSIDLGLNSSHESSHTSERTSTDGDRTVTESTSSQTADEQSTGLSTGNISIDPAATIDAVTQSTDRSDRGGGSASSSSSESSGSASAPIHIEGVELRHDSTSERSDSSTRTATDGDRSSTEERSSDTRTERSASLGTGSLDLDPQLDVERSDARSSDRFGSTFDERSQSSSNELNASAPIEFGGLHGDFASETERSTEEARTVVDGDRSVSESTSTHEHTSTDAGFRGGDFAIEPGLAVSDERASARDALVRDVVSEDRSSASAIDAGAPFHFGGFEGWAATENTTLRDDQRTVVDGDRAVHHRDAQLTHTQNAVRGSTGQLSGAPEFGFARSDASTSDRVGSLRTGERHSATRGSAEAPFDYSGAALAADSVGHTERLSESVVIDGERSSSLVERSTETRSAHPVLGFDGIAGHPGGAFDTDKASKNRRH